MDSPNFQDVLRARQRIAPYLKRTPTHRYAALDDLIGTSLYVKHENHQPVCAFKVRGGINLVSQLSDDEKRRGVITASTGNHGQSIAYAARLFGVTARVCVPMQANPVKVAAMRGMGAELIFHGERFDDARKHCEALAHEHGYRYIHSGNEPLLIAGVATETFEMIEDAPNIEVVIVPVGGGSGAAGACIAAKAINKNIKVIAVQSERAPAAYLSWKNRAAVTAQDNTFAEGLSTSAPFELPQQIMREMLDDFVTVPDELILQAMTWYLEHAHSLAEGAGAATLAAAYQLRDQLRGKTVGIICSGGNSSLAHLQMALDTAK
jgi:threonine dehydratase